MNCPVCDAKLRAIEKSGIEVDICPDCKGIWLDRGEMEKLIEMAATDGPVQQRSPDRSVEREREREDDRGHHDDDHGSKDREHGRESDSGGGKPRKKGSWLGDVLGSFGGED